ncbi:hypothetical protein DNU06_04500 [Putridiphycobacter roseus]|uniref:DUF4932 domain-containing protein n=1 Tax=Putridiphycobacter roseus TaxID=2219161 RepID=A0A2W1N244_9FLAO|nr:hypothetical protein [Putridiphycobacter roseus]PZE17884.1 hypothetical protein DNU06_04500 [Putridiphycobacter roseus]
MKQISVLFIFICTQLISFGQEKPQVKIKFSVLYATYDFVRQLSAYYPDSEYKKVFKNSAFNNEKYKQLLQQFDTLRLTETVPFHEYPKGQKLPLSTSDIMSKNLISSNSLNEFKTKMFGIIPSSELLAFANIMDEFKTVYLATIYNPNKEKFEQKVAELIKYVENTSLDDYFQTGLAFYHTAWDNAIIFEIAVIPSINKNGFTASAFMNNAASEIQIDFKEYDILFSVLMHEIYHIQYNEETLAFKKKMAEWFKKNPSKNSQYAYLLLNEVLATALGNGYVYEQINKQLDEYDWYNNKYINLMAKKLYPTVKEYIMKNKSLDKAFIDKYISIYDTSFADWTNELNHILTYRYILVDEPAHFDFFLINYPQVSAAYMEDRIDLLSLSRLKETPVTKIIIVSNHNSNKLNEIKTQFSALHKWNFDPNQEFIITFDLKDKTKLIIVNAIKTSPNDLLIKQFENGRIH